MRLSFNKIIIHNFLSYGHSEINLKDRGYCLVSGINRCPKDNALSNGSGKSSWISAICWCLTGETVQGITRDLKNHFIDENSCYVTLFFSVDDKNYEVTRIVEPKSDLKIIIDNEDKSGKGIRESELILATYLPDLTKNLISSVILLGQGLPNKLSAHTPSGRKEMLEQLSKSDFMIEDIKNRISTRVDELNTQIRTKDDALLVNNSTLTSKKKDLEESIEYKNNAISYNYDKEIEDSENLIKSMTEDLNKAKISKDQLDITIKSLTDNLLDLNNKKNDELMVDLSAYNEKRTKIVEVKSNVQGQINALQTEITRLKNIKDVCPTCGRPFEGVVKPDTTQQEEQLNQLNIELATINSNLTNVDNEHLGSVNTINSKYNTLINSVQVQLDECRRSSGKVVDDCNDFTHHIQVENERLVKLKADKENEDKNWKALLEKIDRLTTEVNTLEESIKLDTKERTTLSSHLDVVKKMDTLVKRDFRGFLLSNVINFIDHKCKEYCVEVFGSDEISFTLDGNNIDISYCGKSFESLSGGEKQKVDIILQFAIRDMMSTYLDFSSNILCLDEIFDNLDSKCTSSVLNLIANKLSDVESLFIISHHSDELSIPSDCELIIEKSEKGISEVR